MSPRGNRSMLRGEDVVRVHWVLGTDLLRAVCHCGAERLFEDPIVLWEWVLAHPDGHRPGPAEEPPQPYAPVAARL